MNDPELRDLLMMIRLEHEVAHRTLSIADCKESICSSSLPLFERLRGAAEEEGER